MNVPSRSRARGPLGRRADADEDDHRASRTGRAPGEGSRPGPRRRDGRRRSDPTRTPPRRWPPTRSCRPGISPTRGCPDVVADDDVAVDDGLTHRRFVEGPQRCSDGRPAGIWGLPTSPAVWTSGPGVRRDGDRAHPPSVGPPASSAAATPRWRRRRCRRCRCPPRKRAARSGTVAQRTVDSLVRPMPFRSWSRLMERTCRSVSRPAPWRTHTGITTVFPSTPGQPAGEVRRSGVATHGDRRPWATAVPSSTGLGGSVPGARGRCGPPDGGMRAALRMTVADELDHRPWCFRRMTSNAAASERVDHFGQIVDVDPTGHLGEPAMSTKPTVVADGP